MVRISNEYLQVVISKIGAELQSIKDKNEVEYLWQGNPDYWASRATNLFPFVGRLSEGKYTYKGKEYSMTNHGFCRGNEFQVIQHSENCVELFISSDEHFLKIYPFQFRFSIIYTIEENKLEINYKVINQDDKTIYFGVGGHPGFNVPMDGIGTFEDYYLEFDETCKPVRMGVSTTCFMNGEDIPYPVLNEKTIPLKHDLFDEDAIILKEMSKRISIKNKVNKKVLEVTYPDMKYLAIWHAVKKDAPYVCIEPWTTLPSRDGIVEDIATHPDMNVLESGAIYENKWYIKII